MAVPEPTRRKLPAPRSERVRLAAAAGLGALVVVFAFLNHDEVDVNWLLGTWSTPLIVVIVLCVVLGMAIDRVLVRRGRRQRRGRTPAERR